MKGLLLVGGKSTRMGQDKSQLILREGITQRERGIQLLQSICDKVFISTAQDEGQNSIPDAYGNIGPLGAIASAQKHNPDTPWLILACDLPLLEQEHLSTLCQNRQTDKDATYFLSATDQFPEPLCAIWEPSSISAVKSALDAGQRCPRSVLKHLNGNPLPNPGLWSLANSNTEADLIEIRARLDGTLTQKKITIEYYAQLRELTGTTSESISTDSITPAGLFEEIRAKYQLPLKRKGMMIAVNGDFTDWTHTLAENEEIVFIPPVAGG